MFLPAQRRLLWPSLVSNSPRDIVGLVLPGVRKEAFSGKFPLSFVEMGWLERLSSGEQGGELMTAIILPQNMLSRCCPMLQSPALFSPSYKEAAVLTFPVLNPPLLFGWGSCTFNTLCLESARNNRAAGCGFCGKFISSCPCYQVWFETSPVLKA